MTASNDDIDLLIDQIRVLKQAANLFPESRQLILQGFRVAVVVSQPEMVRLIERFETSPGMALKTPWGIILFGVRIIVKDRPGDGDFHNLRPKSE